MKSQVQAGYGTTIPVYKRMMMIVKQRGFFALYRGFIPGTMRSFAGNRIGMIVFFLYNILRLILYTIVCDLSIGGKRCVH